MNWRQVHEFTPHLLDRKRQVINHCQVVTNTPCNFSQKKLDLLFNNKVSIFVAIWMWINKISTLNAFSFHREHQFFIELFANSLLLLLSLTKSWSTFSPNIFAHSHMLVIVFHFVASNSFLCFRVLWNIITFQSPNLILIVWLCLTFVINLKDIFWWVIWFECLTDAILKLSSDRFVLHDYSEYRPMYPIPHCRSTSS